jgi:hypothetical protein
LVIAGQGTLLMAKADSTLYAIGTTDAAGFHLLARIVRRPKGIFYLIERSNDAMGIDADRNWDPHASYHRDGRHHVKSFDQLVCPATKRQPLDQSFTGSEPLFDHWFQPGEIAREPTYVGNSSFAESFAVPVALIAINVAHFLSVHLLSPGTPNPRAPLHRLVAEHAFRDAEPWIHVALCADWQSVRHGLN